MGKRCSTHLVSWTTQSWCANMDLPCKTTLSAPCNLTKSWSSQRPASCWETGSAKRDVPTWKNRGDCRPQLVSTAQQILGVTVPSTCVELLCHRHIDPMARFSMMLASYCLLQSFSTVFFPLPSLSCCTLPIDCTSCNTVTLADCCYLAPPIRHVSYDVVWCAATCWRRRRRRSPSWCCPKARLGPPCLLLPGF